MALSVLQVGEKEKNKINDWQNGVVVSSFGTRDAGVVPFSLSCLHRF